MRTGTANLPLHGGKCPAWLFLHMKKMCAAIMEVIIEEYGANEVLHRLSDPYWFQALGCVVGFDWHSSGVTTTVCGAIKEGLADMASQTGIFIAGGKGKVSRRTPDEIRTLADKFSVSRADDYIYASRMSAKVDSAAVQDGFDIYHHLFIFTEDSQWAVIQQGMNEELKQARRYHWLSSELNSFTEDPQKAICCDTKTNTLNLVSSENGPVRQTSVDLSKIPVTSIIRELKLMEERGAELILPKGHSIPRTSHINKSLYAAYESQAEDFEALMQVPGVGQATLRALCMVAEVAYGVAPSYKDPVRYAFAHGGKDGFPFPVQELDIENSYITLQRALKKARAGQREQMDALRRLSNWHSQAVTFVASPPSDPSICMPCPCQPSEVHSDRVFQPGLFK